MNKKFATEEQCLEYLFNAKMKFGFRCKCGCTKYKRGAKETVKFASLKVKCSKCDTLQTATSNTYFHNFKGDIVKAFAAINEMCNQIYEGEVKRINTSNLFKFSYDKIVREKKTYSIRKNEKHDIRRRIQNSLKHFLIDFEENVEVLIIDLQVVFPKRKLKGFLVLGADISEDNDILYLRGRIADKITNDFLSDFLDITYADTPITIYCDKHNFNKNKIRILGTEEISYHKIELASIKNINSSPLLNVKKSFEEWCSQLGPKVVVSSLQLELYEFIFFYGVMVDDSSDDAEEQLLERIIFDYHYESKGATE
ncbi:MAG: hypothetical protein J0I41_23515 [Filimonas sp.]|nr:hypothetical protein [Filimonas sp.]